MKHSLKVFLGLLSFVPFVSNVYGVDYLRATNFYFLPSSAIPSYNVDTTYKKVTVKAYKMTTYFGEYVKESEYPIWEKTATYNNAGYVATITNEAEDTHTIFRYKNNNILAKISTYYISTGQLKEEEDLCYVYNNLFLAKRYYSLSDYNGTYRFSYINAGFYSDGIRFNVRYWGQESDGTYFAGEGIFRVSETWLRDNGFRGKWKNYQEHEKIFNDIASRRNIYISYASGYHFNEYGLKSSLVIKRKDGQLAQAQDGNYCYEYTWSK